MTAPAALRVLEVIEEEGVWCARLDGGLLVFGRSLDELDERLARRGAVCS